MDNYYNKYIKYKKKYLDLKNNIQNGSGYVMENSDITKFKNVDLRDTLNEPSVQQILDNTIDQSSINKHLLTAIVTVDNRIQYKIDESKNQQGGGYVMENSDITKFVNVDIFDTLNEPSVQHILDNTMDQSSINKHLLTAIVTVDNRIQYKIDESKNQQGGGYVMENSDITKFKNVDLRDTLNDSVQQILDNTMEQSNINKHLLTAIVTVDNRIQYKIDESGI